MGQKEKIRYFEFEDDFELARITPITKCEHEDSEFEDPSKVLAERLNVISMCLQKGIPVQDRVFFDELADLTQDLAVVISQADSIGFERTNPSIEFSETETDPLGNSKQVLHFDHQKPLYLQSEIDTISETLSYLGSLMRTIGRSTIYKRLADSKRIYEKARSELKALKSFVSIVVEAKIPWVMDRNSFVSLKRKVKISRQDMSEWRKRYFLLKRQNFGSFRKHPVKKNRRLLD